MVNMFIKTECYHRFHVPCFKEYVKRRLVTPKVNKNLSDKEVTFEDACCMRCLKVVPFEEIREMLSR